MTQFEMTTSVHDRNFGEIAITTLPDELVSRAREAGIDVPSVAQTVRSVTIRARKNHSGVAS